MVLRFEPMDHAFSAYAKFSKKLTFTISFSFSENFAYVRNGKFSVLSYLNKITHQVHYITLQYCNQTYSEFWGDFSRGCGGRGGGAALMPPYGSRSIPGGDQVAKFSDSRKLQGFSTVKLLTFD